MITAHVIVTRQERAPNDGTAQVGYRGEGTEGCWNWGAFAVSPDKLADYPVGKKLTIEITAD